MTSAVQPIQSMPLNPVDLVQAYTPSQIDSTPRAAEVASGAAAIQSVSEREVAFSKLMATSPAESATTQQTSDNWWNVLPSSQTTSSQDVNKIFNSLDKDTKAAINELLATVKKELTATEFQTLKDGWVGKRGTELEFGFIYSNFMNQVIQLGRQITDQLEDLKNA
jgi:hypothetical protein